MIGVEEYESRYQIPVMRIHYTADPDRNPATPEGAEWLKQALRGIPGGMQSSHWRQEQEIDWEAAGGDLVFPQLEAYRSKIVVPPFDIPEVWRLYGSFDYGIRNPSAFLVNAIDFDGNVWTVWEYYRTDAHYRDTARAIRGCGYYERLSQLPICDPSIYAFNQQSENGVKSLGQLFAELPEKEAVWFSAGKRGGDVTVASKVNGDLWANLDTKTPKWRIFMTCPKLIWELGKLRWADWSSSQAQVKGLREEIVDKDNHAWDAFKYFVEAFLSGPQRKEEKPYERLKTTDPASYREWRNVEKMHRRAPGEGLGEFG